MVQNFMTAADLRRFCDGQHSAARAIIDRVLNELAVDVGFNRSEVLRAITEYTSGLSGDLTEDEFYDAVAFLADDDVTAGFDADFVDISAFGEGVLQQWSERQNSPPEEMREPLLRALFNNYLASVAEGGANYVLHHVDLDCWQPNELARGETPAGISLHESGRWVINSVMLPKGVLWSDSLSRFDLALLPKDIRKLVEEKRFHDLLAPVGGIPVGVHFVSFNETRVLAQPKLIRLFLGSKILAANFLSDRP